MRCTVEGSTPNLAAILHTPGPPGSSRARRLRLGRRRVGKFRAPTLAARDDPPMRRAKWTTAALPSVLQRGGVSNPSELGSRYRAGSHVHKYFPVSRSFDFKY